MLLSQNKVRCSQRTGVETFFQGIGRCLFLSLHFLDSSSPFFFSCPIVKVYVVIEEQDVLSLITIYNLTIYFFRSKMLLISSVFRLLLINSEILQLLIWNKGIPISILQLFLTLFKSRGGGGVGGGGSIPLQNCKFIKAFWHKIGQIIDVKQT